jgi:hypothetical protein
MRELREERGLKVCRREMGAELGVPKSLVIVREWFVALFKTVVNKDVMYRSNIYVARLRCFFLWGRFADVRGAWILQC